VNQEEREQNGVDGIKKGKVVICIEKDVDDPARPTSCRSDYYYYY